MFGDHFGSESSQSNSEFHYSQAFWILKPHMANVDRKTLIQMVEQVQNASACVMDFDGMMSRLEEAAGSKEIGNLIFDPPGGKRLKAEEIVEIVFDKKD